MNPRWIINLFCISELEDVPERVSQPEFTFGPGRCAGSKPADETHYEATEKNEWRNPKWRRVLGAKIGNHRGANREKEEDKDNFGDEPAILFKTHTHF